VVVEYDDLNAPPAKVESRCKAYRAPSGDNHLSAHGRGGVLVR
jgi:hypothetical protein